MSDWIKCSDQLPEVDQRIRLLLRDGLGQYESPHVCAMLEDGDFYNVDAKPPVAVSAKIRIVAWKPTIPKPRADWPRFARTIKGDAS